MMRKDGVTSLGYPEGFNKGWIFFHRNLLPNSFFPLGSGGDSSDSENQVRWPIFEACLLVAERGGDPWGKGGHWPLMATRSLPRIFIESFQVL